MPSRDYDKPTKIDERKWLAMPLSFLLAIVVCATGAYGGYAALNNRIDNDHEDKAALRVEITRVDEQRRAIDANQDERIRQLEIQLAKLSDIKDMVNRTADAVGRIEKRMTSNQARADQFP